MHRLYAERPTVHLFDGGLLVGYCFHIELAAADIVQPPLSD
jgi:hypothetical protein